MSRPPEAWTRVCPPTNKDVLLPSWMSDKYRLYMPDRDCDGVPVDWEFKYCRNGVEPESSYPSSYSQQRRECCCGPSCRCGCMDQPDPCCTSQYHDNIPRQPAVRSRIAARAEPMRSYNMQEQGEELGYNQINQTDKAWKVFFADDPGDPHTVICINKILVECRPKLRPHLLEMPLRDWNEATNYHKECTNVGKHNTLLQDCYVSYTNSRPMTHAWVEGVAIHFDELAKLTFTPSAAISK